MNKTVTKASEILLLLFVTLSVLIKIHLGFDCDEQYAFSMMYRFSQGHMYLRDLWNPYQFSALLMTPLFLLCRLISVSYTVLLFRFFSAVLYFLGSIPLYRFLKSETGDRPTAYLGMLVFFTLTPKSIISMEHSNLTALFLTYVLIDLYRYLKYNEIHVLLFASKSVLLAICYPTLSLLAIPVLIIMILRKDHSTAVSYILATLLLGILLIIPSLIANGGIKGFADIIHLILMDGSHQFSIHDRLMSLHSEFRYAARYLLVSLAFFTVLFCWKRLLSLPRRMKDIPDPLLFCTSLFLAGLRPLLISSVSPVAGYYRYSFILLIAMYYASKKKDKPLGQCLVVLFTAMIIMFNSSNNGVMAVSGFCAFALIAIILLWKKDKTGILVLLFSAILCQASAYCISYRVTGGAPRSIFHFDLVQSTVVKGIWTEQADENFFESCAAQTIESKTHKVMVAGTDSYSWIILNGEVFSPSTTGTPVYGDQMKNYLLRNGADDFDLIVEKKFPESSQLLDIVRESYHLRLIYADDAVEHYVAVKASAQ